MKQSEKKSFIRLRLLAMLYILIGCMNLCAAQHLTLEQCIDSALANNHLLQSAAIQEQMSTIHQNTARSAVLPSLNGGATHGYNWGQTIDLFTNQFATDRVMYDNFYLSSSVVLFSGLQNYYATKVAALTVRETALQQQITERNVRMDVGAAYFQVLLTQEIVRLLEATNDHSAALLQEKQQLYDAQQATAFEVAEVQVEVARQHTEWQRARNDLSYSQLVLSQLVNLKNDQAFDIDSLVLFHPDSTMDNDVSDLPEVTQLALTTERQLYLIRSAKGRYYPSLSLNGALGSGYSENNKTVLVDGTIVPKPFNDQLRSNFYQSATLTLTIPIFNKNTIRNQIKMRELEFADLCIRVEQQSNMLRQQLERIRLDIVNAQAQLEAQESLFQLSQKKYDNQLLRYEVGEISFTVLSESRNAFIRAQSSFIQARYELLLKQFILTCYQIE